MHKLQWETEHSHFNWIGWMAWSRRIRMGVAVAVWCTSCESVGSEIMEVPVTTVLVDTYMYNAVCILYTVFCLRGRVDPR